VQSVSLTSIRIALLIESDGFITLFLFTTQLNGKIFYFLGAVSFGTIMWLMVLIPFLIIGMLILSFTDIGKQK